MNFYDPQLDEYIVRHTEAEPPILAALNRETHAKVVLPEMIAGHYQGRTLAMLSRMIRPKTVLEIGTYTGYSAMCWTEGLQDDGQVHTIDINEELEDLVARYIGEAGLQDRITTHIGDARQIIPSLNLEYDLVYIDADKENYAVYYDFVFDSVRPGGFIIADNVLWSGKVLDQSKPDADTRALVAYSDKINSDDRVVNVLLPIRDGLLIAQKK